jgi:hypothetical protein
MQAPIWLRDEPEICALLGAALDRFDALPGDARSRDTWLQQPTRLLSTLERNDERADQLWALIRQLQQLGICSVRTRKRNPYDPEWLGAKIGFPVTSEEILRDWLGRAAPVAIQKQWQEAVLHQRSRFSGNIDLLLQKRITIAGRTAQEVVTALAGLADIQQPATLRQLSSHVFWGDSKLLDERGELIAALFPQLVVRDRPLVVAVHLGEATSGVLFIENQDNYTAAVAGEPESAQGCSLVYMAGFRTAATRIRTPGGACLHFGGAGAATQAGDFESWWFGESTSSPSLWFWGDLDFSGMQILKSLRERFGDVQAWQPGYAPVLAALSAGRARMQADAVGGQIDPRLTGCEYADQVLLPAVRRYGYRDQEGLADG